MDKKPATSIYLDRDEVRRLQELAASLGYYISRGPGTGSIGNISALMRDIANGRLELREDTMGLYEQAKDRVEDDEQLAPHADFILADWPEGDEHWDWVITAPVEEILDWVEAGSD